MEIKTISYKRTNGLGNYSSEYLEMSAELEYDEDPFKAAQELKDTVLISLGLKEPEQMSADPHTIPGDDIVDVAF